MFRRYLVGFVAQQVRRGGGSMPFECLMHALCHPLDFSESMKLVVI